MAGGGAHPLMRTHNRLLNLWGGVYLEVIAIDPKPPEASRGTAPAPVCSHSTTRPRKRDSKPVRNCRTGSRGSTGRSG